MDQPRDSPVPLCELPKVSLFGHHGMMKTRNSLGMLIGLVVALSACKARGGDYPREAQVQESEHFKCAFTRTGDAAFTVSCESKEEGVTVGQIKAILSESEEGKLDEREFLNDSVDLAVGTPWRYEAKLDSRNPQEKVLSYTIYATVIMGYRGNDKFDFQSAELKFASGPNDSN